jgi:hypothetical protein
MPYKVYSYQNTIVQAMAGALIGQASDSQVLYRQVTPPQYQYPFSSQMIHLLKEEVLFLSTMDSTNRPPYVPSKNRLKWSTYPSFFMNLKTIPTNKWSCTSRDSDEQWTCDTSTIDRG